MTELLLDSSILIGSFEDELDAQTEKMLSSNTVSISVISVFEVKKFLYSVGKLRKWEEIKNELLNYQVLPVDFFVCDVAAAYAHQHSLSLADALIYATAKTNGRTLVTADNDFKGLKDVLVVKKK